MENIVFEKNETEKSSIIHEFNQINNEIGSLYHEASLAMGFSDSEMQILYMLCDEGEGITQKHIIDATGMSKQTIHSSVRKMEMKGLIRLDKLHEHSRAILLTEEGRRVIKLKIQPLMEKEESIYAEWTPEERKLYIELIRRYRDGLMEVVRGL